MKTRNTNSKHLNIVGNDGSMLDREAVTRFFRLWRRKLGCFSMLTSLPTLLASQAQAFEPDETQVPLITAAIGKSVQRLTESNKGYRRPEFLQRQTSFLLPHQKGELSIVDAFTGGSD